MFPSFRSFFFSRLFVLFVSSWFNAFAFSSVYTDAGIEEAVEDVYEEIE